MSGGLVRTLSAGLFLCAAVAHASATVVVVNADLPLQGFNDQTPVTPVGGNPGTTLGAQRLAVFQEAARIWGEHLDSAVPITVISQFKPLTCDSAGATLGSAGPTNIFASDDPTLDGGAPASVFPRQKTWYVVAEVERFAGKKLLSGTGPDPANYDIQAQFNSTLDTDPTSCHGFTWYYGLDNQHGNELDLLTTVLHEFGHGLGFISLTDPTTGNFEQNEPDIWSYVLFDDSTGKHWVELDAAGRQASAVSGSLAWDGTSVKTAVPSTLAFPTVFRVTSAPQTPGAVKDYTYVFATFSGQIGDAGVSGPVVMGSTGYGCTGQGRLAPLDGQIAVLDRGGPLPDAGCTFVEKARNAQDAGALALILANNAPGTLTPSGTAPDVVIPVLLVSQADGLTLKGAVDAGPVSAALFRDPSRGYQGADGAHRALMYAPTTFDQGSSVSHWDTSAFPNLLMEPNINPDDTHTLDLTVPALRDIDWFADGGSGGNGGTVPPKSGCTTASGPPAPWLALLGLLAFARRRRPV